MGFDEPGREVERPIAEICEDIVKSAARWFWPAVHTGQLDVLVEGSENGKAAFSQHVHEFNGEVSPFVLAQTETPSPEEPLGNRAKSGRGRSN